jgi:hypothetical protein
MPYFPAQFFPDAATPDLPLPVMTPDGTTFGEIKREAQILLMELPGTEGALASVLLDPLVVDVVDEVCKETDCLYGIDEVEMKAGKALYCPPGLYKLKWVAIKDRAGRWGELPLMSARLAARRLGPDWENLPAGEPVLGVVGAGGSGIRLAPAPADDRSPGLLFEGFWQPGKVWSYDDHGNPEQVRDSSLCPLPKWAVGCVKYGVAYLRCIQFPTKENLLRASLLQREYGKRRGDVEMKAANWYRSVARGGAFRRTWGTF